MMTLSQLLAATPVDTSTVDLAAKHAYSDPITSIAFLLMLIFGAALYWLLFKFYPSWQTAQAAQATAAAAKAVAISEEAQKTREHIASALSQRGAEAETALRAEREHSAQQQRIIVDGIGGRVDLVDNHVKEVHVKVSGLHDLVRAIASRSGIVAGLLVLVGSSVYLTAWGCVATSSRRSLVASTGVPLPTLSPSLNVALAGKECTKSSDCTPPAFCSEGTCCRNTAALTPAKLSPELSAHTPTTCNDIPQPTDSPRCRAVVKDIPAAAPRSDLDDAREYGEEQFVTVSPSSWRDSVVAIRQ